MVIYIGWQVVEWIQKIRRGISICVSWNEKKNVDFMLVSSFDVCTNNESFGLIGCWPVTQSISPTFRTNITPSSIETFWNAPLCPWEKFHIPNLIEEQINIHVSLLMQIQLIIASWNFYIPEKLSKQLSAYISQ